MNSKPSFCLLAALVSLGAWACGKEGPPEWTCTDSSVPGGKTTRCVAAGITVADGTYTCPLNADAVPECPPPHTHDGPYPGTGGFTGAAGAGETHDGVGAAGATGQPDAIGQGGSLGVGGVASGETHDGMGSSGGAAGTTIHDSAGGDLTGQGGTKSTGNGVGTKGGGDAGAVSGGNTTDGQGGSYVCISKNGEVDCKKTDCVSGNKPMDCGACIPEGSAGVDCVAPQTGGCWVTGGGYITDADGNDSFGGNGMPMKDGRIRGEWEHVDHGTGHKLHGQVSYLVCRHVDEPGPGQPSGRDHKFDINQAYFGGPARWFSDGTWAEGYWFDIMAEDHGEPGNKAGPGNHGSAGPDEYHLRVMRMQADGQSGTVVYETQGEFVGGNLQIHPPNSGHPYTSSALPTWVSLQP